jgi:hypothetical protein
MYSMPETYLVSHDLSPKSCMRTCPCCAVADGGGFKHLCSIHNPLYEEDKEEGIIKLEMVMGLSNFHFNTIFKQPLSTRAFLLPSNRNVYGLRDGNSST